MNKVDLSAYHNTDLPKDKDALRSQMMQDMSEASKPQPDEGTSHPLNPAEANPDTISVNPDAMSANDMLAEVLQKKTKQDRVGREVIEELAERVQSSDKSIRFLEEILS